MAHFLQSFEWEHFQKKVGRKTFRTQSGVLVVLQALSGGMNYAFVGGAAARGNAIEEAKRIAITEHAQFLKWETMEEYSETAAAFLKSAGFRQASHALQPQQTIRVNLMQDTHTLLAAMHYKTRYHIGLATRNGVQIHFHKNPSEAQKNIFWEILQETATRDGFHLHGNDYYFALCDVPGAELAFAEVRGQVVAAHLILFYEETATYLHGGSTLSSRAPRASYRLQWESIQEAKQRGFKIYDFWGIDEKRWPGLTRFKEGFGGNEVTYLGSWDYVFSRPFYAFYKLRQWIRRQ